uniref:Uncharacterized protein n=1 Tax=Avena sativa TaxID=4498 RepID=A0ACD5YRA6_AVESA
MPGSGAGVQAPEASPGRYVRRHDEVPPDDDGCDDVLGGGDARGPGDDPFDIPAKRAPVERLRRWRQAALVLNASRRFRYTLDLKKEEEKEHIRRKIRAHAQVIRAALLFKEAGEKQNGDRELPEIPPRGFGIGEEQLTSMTRDHNFSTLQEYGGVKGLLNLLKTNSEKGIHGDEEDLSCRANAFGANRYPRKKGRSFWASLFFIILDIPSEEQRISWQLPDNDLTLIGIVGMKDPCRPGVRDAVELCTNSGVKVRMVTGDNLQTARAIALECGILTDPQASTPVIIEGRVFRAFSDAQREEVADKISVMGRSSPNDKLLLVKALKKNGHVVAVTGDGTNDAPALHEADIGLSMGIQGTEVAKESSDIIILDDNFASVVKVVRWGRSVYANIQKFIQFQLTVNVAALIINVVAAISSGNVPLNAVQVCQNIIIYVS